jgi:hypothetical protein
MPSFHSLPLPLTTSFPFPPFSSLLSPPSCSSSLRCQAFDGSRRWTVTFTDDEEIPHEASCHWYVAGRRQRGGREAGRRRREAKRRQRGERGGREEAGRRRREAERRQRGGREEAGRQGGGREEAERRQGGGREEHMGSYFH